ncbi:MAG: lipoate--protein ligase [Desulfacinum sp.]|jgi:lipoate-protein ligase A|nr:lipoate--protein ligase [Desulfacinum sp.]
MIGVWLESTDAAWNLAAEEYLLRNVREDCFLLWRNRPAVVFGRNQIPHAEVDHRFLLETGTALVRRQSGGGAVYHDLGNVNFSFLRTRRSGPSLDYERLCQPVLAFLTSLGLPVRPDGKSDISLGGLKISGNAQYATADRHLYHGTLLFDTDLEALGKALAGKPEKYRHGGVKSVRRRVTNIRPHLVSDMTVETFMENLWIFMRRRLGFRTVALSQEDERRIADLAGAKYAGWRWTYGTSPPYEFQNARSHGGDPCEVRLKVVRGIIQEARVEAWTPVSADGDLSGLLEGCPHDPASLRGRLAGRLKHPVGNSPDPEFFLWRLL